MRIKCPECESVLSLSQPKPGRYHPKCKRCGKPFRIQVTGDDPPGVKVSRVKESPKASTKPPAAPQVANAATIASGDPIASGTPAPSRDPAAEKGPDKNSPGSVDATLDTASSSHAASQTAGHTEATINGTTDGDSAKKPIAVSKGGDSGSRAPRVSAGPSLARSGRSSTDPGSDGEIPERLGGYRILRLLGRGAMGAVYEAKQISLDRLVALKTIRGRLANNPSTLARFTREAYSAAQLTHHNVVQIYDFGEDGGKHFFSMEYVRGGPLSELVQEKGVIDPRLAAGYALQAARGLQFAHRSGMVHRDVKPANLLLNDEGVVKVADLGLVKIPDQMDPESDLPTSSMSGLESGTQVTMQGTAVGTPAYMAPEQSVDATGVDHRADIYSLGCTLFYLLTGKPPFDGNDISQVMEQHANEQLPSLANINSRVPEPLQKIVERSMAKRPDDRYASLSEMIAELESYLGVNADGKFSPTSNQADQWEALVGKFASATALLRWTKPIFVLLAVVCTLISVVLPLVGFSWLLLGPVLFASSVATALALGASGGRSAVVHHFRRWIGSLSWFDLGTGVLGAMIFLLVAFVSGLTVGAVVGTVLGIVCGSAYHFLLIVPSRRKSESVIKEAERFIRDLRIDGADEDGVRSFAARYGGKNWPDLFEWIFGYEALANVREQLKGDPNFSSAASRSMLRDRICTSLSSKANTNRRARDHQRLAQIEQRGLQSEGLSASDARDRAWQMADAVMEVAKIQPAADTGAKAAADAKRQRMKAMLSDARSGKYAKKRDKLALLRFALGGQMRLLAGCILLAVFAIWAKQSGLLDQVTTIAEAAATEGSFDSSVVEELKASAATADSGSGKNWSIGIAGLLLVLSAFVSGWRMTPFAAVATIVILMGSTWGIPGVGGLLAPWMVSALVGVAIYLPGILFGETGEG